MPRFRIRIMKDSPFPKIKQKYKQKENARVRDVF